MIDPTVDASPPMIAAPSMICRHCRLVIVADVTWRHAASGAIACEPVSTFAEPMGIPTGAIPAPVDDSWLVMVDPKTGEPRE